MNERPDAAAEAVAIAPATLSRVVRQRIFLYLGVLIVLLAFGSPYGGLIDIPISFFLQSCTWRPTKWYSGSCPPSRSVLRVQFVRDTESVRDETGDSCPVRDHQRRSHRPAFTPLRMDARRQRGADDVIPSPARRPDCGRSASGAMSGQVVRCGTSSVVPAAGPWEALSLSKTATPDQAAHTVSQRACGVGGATRGAEPEACSTPNRERRASLEDLKDCGIGRSTGAADLGVMEFRARLDHAASVLPQNTLPPRTPSGVSGTPSSPPRSFRLHLAFSPNVPLKTAVVGAVAVHQLDPLLFIHSVTEL
jgi:hypothetical protein